MATFYFDKIDNTIRKWNENLFATKISTGDSITVEYKKIRVATCFNKHMKNKIMVLNNIKDKQTKEKSEDSIIYYDDDLVYKKCSKGEYFDIGDFDPSKYGNSVCYYNPGYQKNPINIVTRIYKVDDSHIIGEIVSAFGKLISLGSVVPTYGVFFSMAGQIVQSTETFVSKLKENSKKVTENHVLTFRIDDNTKPFVCGSYLCIPDMDDENQMEEIIKNYYVEDNCLLKKIGNNIEEYYGNYFIMEVTSGIREDLLDYNFTASSNKLLMSINGKDEVGLKQFLDSNKNASDCSIIKNLTAEWKNPGKNIDSLKAMYNHLHDKDWFKETFPHIFNDLF